MTEINGYQLSEAMTTRNAGFCCWGFCTKNSHEYFIKEFLSPVYPGDDSELSPKVIQRKQRLCETFFEDKKAFYMALSKCRTGNNVVVEEFFRWGSKFYTVTDRIRSVGTDPRIVSRMDDVKKMTLLRSILYSVAVFHEAGIIHADIKPDNLLLKQTLHAFYTAKIIDFDSGFLVGKVPRDVQGDFLYLSPEMFRRMNDEEVDITPKIDIFALGILFHQYWTGALPGIDPQYHYVFEAVLDGSAPVVNPAIPDPLRPMIGQMLQLDPNERPTARSLHYLLSNMDAPQPEGSPQPPPPPRKRPSGFYVPTDFD